VLVLAYGALGLSALAIAARAWPSGTGLERALLAAILVPALAVGVVVALGWLGAIAPLPFAAALAILLVAALLAGRRAGLDAVAADTASARAVLRSIAAEPVLLAPVAVGLVPFGLATAAAALTVPWAWDALGYHLPIVHDALYTRTLRDVPTTVAYVNTYPHFVDLSFVAFRLALGGPTLIELGQLPFVPAGLLGVALMARQAGVPTPRALALALPLAAIPVFMLELATNYVDVAVACLALAGFALTGAAGRPAWLGAGLALGMLLGSKPSAPPLAALGLALLLLRAHRAGGLRWGLLGSAVALVVGSPTYLRNLREHGNPTWPVELRLGPLAFPGEVPVSELAAMGLREPHRSMGWLGRLVSSWAEVLPDRPIYDMRIGGLGPAHLLLVAALVPLAVALARSGTHRQRLPGLLAAGLCGLGTLAAPAAYWARYTLAWPGALLVGFSVLLELLPRARRPAILLLAALSAGAVVSALPGFTASGPSLWALSSMSEAERMAAVAVDEQELDWAAARESVPPGGSFGYDPCFGMPGRIVRADARSGISYLDQARLSLPELDAWLRRERVRVVVLGEAWHAPLARAHPERFRERFRSLYPDWQPCAVFDVLGD
jgi:hypothetical protein